MRVWTQTRPAYDQPEPTDISNEREIMCSIQPAHPEDIHIQDVNFELDCKLIYTKDSLSRGEYCEIENQNYFIIQNDLWNQYGFNEVVAELVKS